MYASRSGNMDVFQTLFNHPEVDINGISDVCALVLTVL